MALPPSIVVSNNSSTPLSYFLGASDISKIVDAILPILSPFLPKLTNEQQYALLHRAVLMRVKGKTFSNKDELNAIVKNIVNNISQLIVNYNYNYNYNITGGPEIACCVCGISLCGSCPSVYC